MKLRVIPKVPTCSRSIRVLDKKCQNLVRKMKKRKGPNATVSRMVPKIMRKKVYSLRPESDFSFSFTFSGIPFLLLNITELESMYCMKC